MDTAYLDCLTPREFAFWPTPDAEHRMGVLMVVDDDGERLTLLCDPEWLDLWRTLDPVARREVGMPDAAMLPALFPGWPDEWSEGAASYVTHLTEMLAVEDDFTAYRERYIELLADLYEDDDEDGAA